MGFLVALVLSLSTNAGESLEARLTVGSTGSLVEFVDSPYVLERKQEELTKWLRDYDKWREWADEWLNRCRPGLMSPCGGKRLSRPDPPGWLKEDCENLMENSDSIFLKACTTLRDYEYNLITWKVKEGTKIDAVKKEKETRSSFLKYINFDSWMTGQSRVWLYGAGMHIAIPVKDRLNLFIAPGFTMLRVPSIAHDRAGIGQKTWTPAYDFGVGFHIFDYGPNKYYLNVAKAWVIISSNSQSGANFRADVDLIGLSVTFK